MQKHRSLILLFRKNKKISSLMLTFGPNDCAHRVKIIFKMSLEIKLGKVLKKKTTTTTHPKKV